MIESVFEDAALKRDLFNQMAQILSARQVPPEKITLCSNTMTLPMQAIIEDVQQKEYRGSCIGMRFLHPVWFIDEVELTDCDYTRRNTAASAEKTLKQLFFQPFLYDGCNRRKLTLQEITTYQSRQRLRCPEPITSIPQRGLRKKFGLSASPDGRRSSSGDDRAIGSESAASSGSSQAPPGMPEDAEPCAVCPRSRDPPFSSRAATWRARRVRREGAPRAAPHLRRLPAADREDTARNAVAMKANEAGHLARGRRPACPHRLAARRQAAVVCVPRSAACLSPSSRRP